MSDLMSIPCTFENELLTINCLRVSATAADMNEAYQESIKDKKSLTGALSLGKVQKDIDALKRTFYSIILPFNQAVLNHLLEIEPLPLIDKPKKKNSSLIEATPEDTLKLGY